jgi:hypothetical protein
MMKFLAGVLSVIAVGVMLIAYGLLNGHTAAAAQSGEMSAFARPMLASERVMLTNGYAAGDPYAVRYMPAVPNGYVGSAGNISYVPYAAAPQAAPQAAVVRPVRTSSVTEAPARQTSERVVQRSQGRDWKKTALVIGGSTAAAAGVGAIFGGKKGALIGAAIGGGASTIYETRKK